MILDSLIGAYVRHLNRELLRFQPLDGQVRLPPPDENRKYLLYLHVPFCVVLCPFCSFHRVRYERDGAERYFELLGEEIEHVTDAGYRFDELYVGGGTPTVLPAALASTIRQVRKRHEIDGISVETNPDDLGKEGISSLRDAGVSRLSVGVQSFDDQLLREMERLERYGSGAEMTDRLRRAEGHFDTLNVDMIFNFPHQTVSSLRRDLEILTGEIGVDQVSFYPLMSVNSTQKKMLQTMGRVDYARERGLYELIVDHMLGAGYSRTSAWCFSRKPGMFDEYIVERDEYVGLGSGSFSYLNGSLFASTFSINHYDRLVAAGMVATSARLALSDRDQMRYYLLMRLFSGTLDKSAAEQRFADRFHSMLWADLTALQALGVVHDDGVQLSLTKRGYYLWVTLMREFFTGVNNLRDQMRHNIPREITALGPA
ncbi:MAG: coproporphyrinogen III oxidase family protein [Acidiferrobacterales bacterium]|nr:coproporphyrinogen III oxidase family protein [Acidiferrobacterales bacterium]